MPIMDDEHSAHQDKSLRLLKFLQEFVKLRSRVIRDLESYEQHIWFSDMPQTNGCSSAAWTTLQDDSLWLELHKQTFPMPPALPAELTPWVDEAAIHHSGANEPELRQVIYLSDAGAADETSEDTEPQLVAHQLDDYPNIASLWQDYLEQWLPWSQEDVRRKSVQKLYNQLFDIYNKLKQQGEALELVVGIGLYSQKAPHLRRHLLAAKTEISFDSKAGVIRLRCPESPEGANLTLEDEFIENKPLHYNPRSFQANLEEFGNVIWETENTHLLLNSIGNALNPDIIFSDSLAPGVTPSDGPSLTFAPALILRKRGLQGILKTYQDIIRQVEDRKRVPFGLARLVDYLDDADAQPLRDSGAPSDTTTHALSENIYFPLPTNDEQRDILERLHTRQGVLVQGPPGTGKSHTIANLICHLLAIGKRILVTSETPRALQVLKEKIPEEVKPLCVSLLGASTESFNELNASINGITERHTNPRDYTKNIAELEERLRQIKGDHTSAYKQLLELREVETYTVDPLGDGSYQGSAATIAKRVRERQKDYGWIGSISISETQAPLTNMEVLELLHSLRELSNERIDELVQPAPELDTLPSTEQFNAFIAKENAAKTYSQRFDSLRQDPAYIALAQTDGERREALVTALREFLSEREKARKRPEAWITNALADVLSGREKAWELLFERTREELDTEGLKDTIRKASRLELTLPDHLLPRKQVLEDAREVRKHLAKGGKWNPLWGPTKGRGYLRKDVLVKGHPAQTLEQIENVILVLSIEARLNRLWELWDTHATRPSGALEIQFAEFEEYLSALELTFRVKSKADRAKELLEEYWLHIQTPDWSSERPNTLLQLLEAIKAEQALEEAQGFSSETKKVVAPLAARFHSHPINQQLLKALDTRDQAAWTNALAQLGQLESDRKRYERMEALKTRLHDTAPEAAEKLSTTPHENIWDSRLEKFEDAWRWGQAALWLREREEPRVQQRLERKLHESEKGIANLMAKLASEKAWQSFMSRLSPKQQQSLQAWKQAVKKIGKGKGKSAARYRAAAREYMNNCTEAIPAWIMPRYRLSEMLPAEAEMFDVVIVDESSQTGIDGLFLFYLGNKVVIVGDDEQISPADVGIDTAAVDALQRKFVDDLPFKDKLTPTHSLYDHASIHFGGKIVLREHFRCMPEIIEFSNQLCYAPNGTPLIPLRNFTPDRLEPVITHYVERGFQEGKANSTRNVPEAEAIVAQIKACVEDTHYEGKSFGVISLLGKAQANLIQQQLIETIGPEEMERRELICGDAYAFQGNERDVMFLSLVSAPEQGKKIGALTRQDAKQRFNVAASRAKDQMWLFHSARLMDLSPQPDCVRRRLLEYCLNPYKQPLTVGDIDIQTLKDACDDPFRGDKPPEPFDSWFEVDVFLQIIKRGYRVTPQVKVAGYRIDLVVESSQGRLAVECDGDKWHGLEQYEHDMARQRQLERSG